MKPEKIDLSAGVVIHIKDFSSRGFSPKNKYLFVIGVISIETVIGFLISSQLHYLKMDSHKNEVIRIPANAAAFPPVESIIQCFQLEQLSIDALCEDSEDGKVEKVGRLSAKYLYKVQQIVSQSKLLPQEDIDLVVKTLDLKKK